MPSLTTLPGPHERDGHGDGRHQDDPTLDASGRSEAGASGAWRWGVPLRMRCTGRSSRTTKRMMRGTDSSSPWIGVEVQNPAAGM